MSEAEVEALRNQLNDRNEKRIDTMAEDIRFMREELGRLSTSLAVLRTERAPSVWTTFATTVIAACDHVIRQFTPTQVLFGLTVVVGGTPVVEQVAPFITRWLNVPAP
jgi:hypothetical protein